MDDIDELARRAEGLVRDGRRAIVGIAGPPGSGKTTLAERLVFHIAGGPAPATEVDTATSPRCTHVPMDGFHLADASLRRLGLLDRKGMPETFDAAGYVATLERIMADDDETVYVPGFDRDLEQPLAAAIAIPPSARLIVTEGNYLLLDDPPWNRLRGLLAETWYVETPDALRRDRLIDRHVRFGKSVAATREWVARVDDPNARLVAATRSRADLVIPG